ncbi:MAG: serine hydroxymethyltransferase [Pseudomonadota bacterium]|nr:serine hydroxymethyltransferase [Gammaproteobacteria bacterium]MDQ3580744.1 serine hydroxymethyltransferase [Pseudomonadota bacterium]
MFTRAMTIAGFDDELSRAMEGERQRQEDHIELIASENYVSPRVLEAQGSVLTNKYAEGYPGKRYYGGCEHMDVVEQLAIDRAKQLFGAGFANVQPHSGSQANGAVYLALINPGDTIMGMSLAHGGHLTHGASVNVSGRIYKAVQYGLNTETEEIDYDEVERLALEHKPKLIMTGFSAYSRVVDWQRFRDIADRVGAYLIADIAHVAGLVATGLYPSPIDIADVTTTTTHKTLRGPRSGLIMGRANPDIEKKINFMVFPAYQGGPLMHVIAGKAVAFREAMQPEFKVYAEQVIKNARAMCRVFLDRGIKIVSGGTDNHLFLVDLVKQGLTGKALDAALGRARITVNKNAVPNDPQPPFVTSGIRIGSPAATTRGFKEPECRQIATWICDIIANIDDDRLNERIRGEVADLCRRFPVYGL